LFSGMGRRLYALLLLSFARTPSSLRVGPLAGPPGRFASTPCRSTASVPSVLVQPMQARVTQVCMQEPALDFYDEYVETDPVTGEKKTLALDEKEKLYLECLDAYYNEGGKQLLSDSEYEQLKLDMDFDGSKVATYSKDEIKFVLANKRFKMGKAIMNDAEYDALRTKLKDAGSLVVLHDGASCSVETGLCKTDLREDDGKTRLLYLPGTAGGLLLVMEGLYWTTGLDPIFSVLVGAVPAYFFGVWFTENIFAQKPLVVQATCPECSYIFPLFFGDLFSVMTDGIVPGGAPDETILCKCAVQSCKIDLEATRSKMIISTVASKKPA